MSLRTATSIATLVPTDLIHASANLAIEIPLKLISFPVSSKPAYSASDLQMNVLATEIRLMKLCVDSCARSVFYYSCTRVCIQTVEYRWVLIQGPHVNTWFHGKLHYCTLLQTLHAYFKPLSCAFCGSKCVNGPWKPRCFDSMVFSSLLKPRFVRKMPST